MTAVLPEGKNNVLDVILYVDGEKESISASAGRAIETDVVTNDVRIGDFGGDAVAREFDGLIDNVMIFDRDLLDWEIMALARVIQEDIPSDIVSQYDDAGNTTKDHNGYAYVYDYENRIIEITKGSDPVVPVAEYAYDALGRRICMIDKIADPDVTTLYYYNNNWQVLTETDEAGDEQRSYIYGNYIDEVLTMIDHTDSDAEYYYAHDHLYSPASLMESDGSVVERYEYDAYGKMTRLDPDFTEWSSTEVGNPYYFTGRRVDVLDDENFTLQYSRNRYYDYYTGRMLTTDKLGVSIDPSTPFIWNVYDQYSDSMSLYEYVRSSPLNGLDPYGNKLVVKIFPGNKDGVEGNWINTYDVGLFHETLIKSEFIPNGIPWSSYDFEIECGFNVWKLTGKWCATLSEIAAAAGGYDEQFEKQVECLANCWVDTHKNLIALGLAGASTGGTAAYDLYPLDKVIVNKLLGIGTGGPYPDTGIPRVTSILLRKLKRMNCCPKWISDRAYAHANHVKNRLTAGGGRFTINKVKLGIRSAGRGVVYFECGVALWCSYKCGVN